MREFPADFRWGAATAAYQIEGAAGEDGRLPSIWDTFSHTPGAVLGGDTGDVACDHYHRYRDDVALMAELGIHDYRFSISWPRVFPLGSGRVNGPGLDFYDRLVDELQAQGVRPLVTLYHWDLPQALQDVGGWTNRDTAARFAELAAVVAARLGDRVPAFTTLNEPWCSAFLGHRSGEHAPGLRDDAAAFAATHHLLLGHGLAAQALRAATTPQHQVSVTLNPTVARPASDSPGDRKAARLADLVANRLFLEPLLRGRLPDGVVEATAAITDWGFVRDGDLATIAAPIDFLGVNYYTVAAVSDVRSAGATEWPGFPGIYTVPEDGPRTGMDWHVDPSGMTGLLVEIGREYPEVPLVVTENGSAFPDSVDDAGRVADHDRAEYLRAHVAAVLDAIEAGVDVRGYFVWSLLDNFEWAWGYSQRFGIVHVDFATQERRLKASAELYRQIVAAHGVQAQPSRAAHLVT